MKARELMSSDLDWVTPDDAITRAAQLMRDRDIGSLPVVESKDSMRLTGIITDRDITVRHVAEGHKPDCAVREAMSTGELATVRPDDDESSVMELMKSRQVRRVPVCEDGGRVVGMIAQADLALKAKDEEQVEETVERISEPSRR
ncbi:MAG TPA: CBS domain-containing protein [Longimicrobiales bacterium]|nr:CBS domain-containing protein [Longimicrobiales bacterium]